MCVSSVTVPEQPTGDNAYFAQQVDSTNPSPRWHVDEAVRSRLLLLAACSQAASAPAPGPTAPARAEPARPPLGDPSITGRVTAVRAIAAVDGGPATDGPVYARRDQAVTLYALVEDDHHTLYSDAPAVRLHGRSVRIQPLARAPRLSLTWNRVEPADASMSNTDSDGGNFHFTQIDYRETPIAGSTDLAALAADVRPTLTPDHGGGVGTMRFQVVVTQGERQVASAGPDARRGRGSGGLTDDVLRVSVRRDDTYLGYLTEMFGQPYIWASAGLSDATHQSERLEGSDCADFVVYGARRAGKRIAYTWTGGLPEVTKLLASGTRGEDGVYRDAAGKPLPFTAKGDLVLFPRHVGVLAEDRGTIGVLDDQDLMMHTLFDSPKEQPIADSGYADKPVELRRFR
jgi:hypothetical protein